VVWGGFCVPQTSCAAPPPQKMNIPVHPDEER
jgi:hypothetical protein